MNQFIIISFVQLLLSFYISNMTLVRLHTLVYSSQTTSDYSDETALVILVWFILNVISDFSFAVTFIVKFNFLSLSLYYQVSSGSAKGKFLPLCLFSCCCFPSTISLPVSLWSVVEVKGHSIRQQDRVAPSGQVVKGETLLDSSGLYSVL